MLLQTQGVDTLHYATKCAFSFSISLYRSKSAALTRVVAMLDPEGGLCLTIISRLKLSGRVEYLERRQKMKMTLAIIPAAANDPITAPAISPLLFFVTLPSADGVEGLGGSVGTGFEPLLPGLGDGTTFPTLAAGLYEIQEHGEMRGENRIFTIEGMWNLVGKIR
jgi:hypothetical protein